MKLNHLKLIAAILVLVGCAVFSSQAQIIRVNTSIRTTGSNTNNLNLTVSAPNPGNTLIAVIAVRGNATGGVRYIAQTGVLWLIAAKNPNAAGVDTEIWYAPNIAAGADTNITINIRSSTVSSVVIAEYSGLSPVTPVDGAALNSGSSTWADTGSTLPTMQAQELWFGGIGLASATATLSAFNNSFTLVSNTTSVYALEKIVSAPGTAQTGGNLSSSGSWSGAVVAFKSAPVRSISQITNLLASVAGVHPRLFLNAAGVSALQAMTNTGKYNFYWTNIYGFALSLASQNPPAYDPNADMRGNGDNMADLAFAWLLSGNTNILNGAVNWATNICNYPLWGPTNSTSGLNYGHQLLGLAMIYDYAYAQLDPATRQLIYNTLIYRGGQEYLAFASGSIGPIYLSNQEWSQSAGVLAAGLATFDQPTNSGVLNWISLMEENFANSALMISPDGVSIEGRGYAEYGDTFLLTGFALSKQLLGTNLFTLAQAWGTNTETYLDDFLIPRNFWAYLGFWNGYVMVPFEAASDDNLTTGVVLRGVAHYYGDTHAQWFADQLDNIPALTFLNNCPAWQFLYWYDGTVPSVSATNLPTLHAFTNMNVVSARSDWSGNESQLTFKCGGSAGAILPAQYGDVFTANATSPGFAHNFPNEGSFCFFGNGDWLIEEPGYVNRDTYFENTLIVDGNCQSGETNSGGLAKGLNFPITTNNPSLTYVSSTPTLDTMVGDATTAYVSTLGLTLFQRHILFVKPNILLVGDNIQVDSTNHTLDLFFHLNNTNSVTVLTNGSLLSTTPNTSMRIDLLTPAVSTMTNSIQVLLATTNPAAFRTLVDIQTSGRTNWQNVMAFNFTTDGTTPAKPTLLLSNAVNWVYQIGTHIVNLNWQATPSNPPVSLSADETRIYGTASTITASVSGGTGTVQFFVDGATYGSAVSLAGGSATIPSTATLGAGTHTVMGIYSGDGTHAGGAAASEAVLTIAPLVANVAGTRVYDGTTNVATGILSVINNLDGANLGLTGSCFLTNKNVGVQPLLVSQISPARVNVATGYLPEGGSQPWSMTVPPPANGDTLVAVLSGHASVASPLATGVTQTGATWIRAGYSRNPGGTATEIWYATNVYNAGTNVSIALNWRSAAVIAEYRGLAAVNPVDVTASNTNISNMANTGTTPTTSQNNELWFGGIGLADSSYTLAAPNNGFSTIGNSQSASTTSSSNAKVYALDKLVTATGSANVSAILSGPIAWSGVMVAFKVAQVTTPLSLTGSAAPNYALNVLPGFVTITNALLTVSGITASNKVYDGTVLAKLNTNNVTWGGNLDGTNVLLKIAGVIGNFLPDGSVGTNKTVQISGLTVSGSATNNYLLIQPTTTANIAAFKVALSFSGNPTTLSATGNPGSSYITQRSTNLVNWVNISTNIATSSGAITISDSFSDLGGHQPPFAFYRLK